MGKAKPFDYVVTANGCFECTSHKAKIVKANGFTTLRIWRDGRAQLLHRWIFEQMFGPIPKGLVVRHKCDNSICCNPEHLELGTQKENMRDKIERGRAVYWGKPVDKSNNFVDNLEPAKKEG